MDSSKTAVLLSAYGSAPSMNDKDIYEYLRHIVQYYRKTDPEPEAFEELRARFEAVGGSPLYEIAGRIRDGLQQGLDVALPGRFDVHLAMKHSPPLIDGVVRQLAEQGYRHGISLPLAPFRSRMSTDGYHELVRDVNSGLDPPMDWRFVDGWYLHPLFLDVWERRIRNALDPARGSPVVIFTNHSLPARIREWNDPYEDEFNKTAEALAVRCGLDDWCIAFQSAGGGGVRWLGPSLGEAIKDWIDKGCDNFLVVPIGFLMDHLEILYDLDTHAKSEARSMGATLTRTQMPNDDPLLVAMLINAVWDERYDNQCS